jgi:calcineurin-like phosphoesterase family protein
MDREFPETWVEIPKNYYRIDLRLGIPRSRANGELERWIGDQGLCRHPDQHPSIILADILSEPNLNPDFIKRVVKKCTQSSGPLQVKLNSDTENTENATVLPYIIKPNRELCEVVRGLSDTFTLGAPEGSIVSCMGQIIPETLNAIPGENNRWRAIIRFDSRSRIFQKVNSHKSAPLQISKVRYDSSSCEEKDQDHQGSKYTGLGAQEKPLIFDILRLTLRKGDTPIAEYDLYLHTWLSYPESVRGIHERRALREFRIQHGYQMTRPAWSKKTKIFVISDLHLGHQNAIPRYKRPFPMCKISEMDRVLIRNWNWTVKKEDTVLFLGDLSFMSQESPESYLKRLAGRIFYLEGNHDIYYSYMSHCLFMNYHGTRFLFIHDPEELVRQFDGWVVHGHVHNKNLTDFPFFNPFEKRINVSAEMIGYRPIPLDEIFRLVQGTKDILDFRNVQASGVEEGEPAAGLGHGKEDPASVVHF